jgi:hypothetical protein
MRKLLISFWFLIIAINLSGCATDSGSLVQAQKGQRLKWNVSYLRGLVIAREALKDEPLTFEKAVITKNDASFKARYNDGRLLQVVISKIHPSESMLTVRLGPGLADQEEARRILLLISQYSQLSGKR